MTVILCDASEGGGDLYGNCPRHGKFLYYCDACQDEWAACYPRTHAAIQAGRSKATVDKAREADRAALGEPS